MGGNALSSKSVRLTRENFVRLEADVVDALKTAFPDNRVHAIQAYRAKADFGDLDVLIESQGYDPQIAATAINAVEVVRNGPVTSMGVKVRPEVSELDGNMFQVDVIKTDSASFDYAAAYFRFNDLGNLIGRTAHRGGTSHGHDGLWYYFRDGDYLVKDILLTQDYDKALVYLGYDPSRFHEGFETLEDIFQYVAGSAFFNRDIFLLENRNAQSRVRDRKRRTYAEFLQWCEARPSLPAYLYPEDKKEWFPRIVEHFPHFATAYQETVEALSRAREAKEKYSGEWVSEVTGLAGKQLGMLMKHHKELHGSQVLLQEHVLAVSRDVLRDELMALKAKLQL